MASLRQRWSDHLDRVGSTRALGLIRIGTALLLWTRWARDLMPLRHLEPDRVALSVAFYVFSSLMLIGLWTRVSVPAMAAVLVLMVTGYGERSVPDWGHHHTTLHMLVVVWLSFMPSGRSFSVDRWLAVRRADKAGKPWPAEQGPLWAVPLLGLQVCALYWWSLVDKIQNGFYTGVQLEQLSMYYYFGADPPEGISWMYPLLAWFVLLLELLLPIGLWLRRWQLPFMALGVIMHLAFYVLIPVKTFSLQMLLLYLAFFDAGAVHGAIDRLLGHGEATGAR